MDGPCGRVGPGVDLGVVPECVLAKSHHMQSLALRKIGADVIHSMQLKPEPVHDFWGTFEVLRRRYNCCVGRQSVPWVGSQQSNRMPLRDRDGRQGPLVDQHHQNEAEQLEDEHYSMLLKVLEVREEVVFELAHSISEGTRLHLGQVRPVKLSGTVNESEGA